MAKEREHTLVLAAAIAADLRSVIRIAKAMSLGVKNARAIATRAGDKARGFHPMTEFIGEVTGEVMNLVDSITHEALGVSRCAAAQCRARAAHRRFEAVIAKAGDCPNVASLEGPLHTLEGRLDTLRVQSVAHVRRLVVLLEEIAQRMRAARVIANISRIEAARAQEYRHNLEAVSDNLESAAQGIEAVVNESRRRMGDLMAV